MNQVLEMIEARPAYAKQEILQRLPVLRRIDSKSDRFYYSADDGISFYPSVTTIIDACAPMPFGLKKWYADMGWDNAREAMDRAAHYGTCMHMLIAEFLQRKQITLDEEIDIRVKQYRDENELDFNNQWWADSLRKDILSFAAFANEKNLEVLAIEVPLSSKLGYGGTADIVGELDFNKKRVRAIIDEKSGKKGFYETHELQLHAYKEAWNETVPDLPVTMVFNWAPKDWTKEPTYTLTNQTDSENAGKFWHYLQIFKQYHDTKPKPFIACKGTVHLGREFAANYEVIDVEKVLTEKHSPSNTAAEALVAADDF